MSPAAGHVHTPAPDSPYRRPQLTSNGACVVGVVQPIKLLISNQYIPSSSAHDICAFIRLNHAKLEPEWIGDYISELGKDDAEKAMYQVPACRWCKAHVPHSKRSAARNVGALPLSYGRVMQSRPPSADCIPTKGERPDSAESCPHSSLRLRLVLLCRPGRAQRVRPRAQLHRAIALRRSSADVHPWRLHAAPGGAEDRAADPDIQVRADVGHTLPASFKALSIAALGMW